MNARGSVTIVVLWGVAIIFALVLAADYTSRGEVLIVRNEVAATRVRAAAEAGTELGLAHLLARRARGVAIFDGRPEPWSDGAIAVAVSISDESGRIDLNEAPPELMDGLFQTVGRTELDAALLTCRVLARRGSLDPDCPDETEAEPSRVFAAPEEIAQLPGFGDALYRAVADDVTVATGSAAIDPMVAPRTVLLALPGATPELVDAWLAARETQEELSPDSSGFAGLPDYPYLAVSPLRDFVVSAIAVSPDGARARADLEVRLTNVAKDPYTVLAFRTPPPR